MAAGRAQARHVRAAAAGWHVRYHRLTRGALQPRCALFTPQTGCTVRLSTVGPVVVVLVQAVVVLVQAAAMVPAAASADSVCSRCFPSWRSRAVALTVATLGTAAAWTADHTGDRHYDHEASPSVRRYFATIRKLQLSNK